MKNNDQMLELLRSELKFIEDGGYGRSLHAPWRAPNIFEDSPTCLNFNDASRPRPCTECPLMQFVPEARRTESVPCQFISLNEHGQTIDYFYRCGTQIEMEEALAGWLQKEINRIEGERNRLSKK